MKTTEVNYLAAECPCCKAGRSDDGREWPWRCACYKACQVVAMGRSCGSPGKCWDGCPYRAPDGGSPCDADNYAAAPTGS